jgi:cytochrome c551/c552
MKNIFVYLVFVFTIVLLFGFAYSINPEGGDGKTIFTEKKCNTCHTVEVVQIESKKKDAVDLSITGDKHNSEFLMKYLTKTEKINDKEHKISMKGTQEEIKTVSEWLASLKSQK